MGRHLLTNDDGAVMVYVAVLATALVGVGALSVDIGRLATTDSQLQSAADAFALAGAAELDGLDGSRARARAAVTAAANRQDFGDTPGAVTVSVNATCSGATATNCIRFLKALPASDDTAIPDSMVATTDEDARFIEVRVAPVGASAIFAGVLGAATDTSLGATSVAGNDPLICDMPPIFMCNPVEDASGAIDYAKLTGRQYKAYSKDGGNSQYFPGNFGLLCPAGTEDNSNCGGKAIQDMLASTSGTCVRRGALTTKPGATVGKVVTGVNVRFDEWDADAKNLLTKAVDKTRYAPALNVTQGKAYKNSCQRGTPNANQETAKQPLDQTWSQTPDGAACADPTLPECRFGGGDADYSEYFRINHQTDGTAPSDYPASLPLNHYNLYRYELETNSVVQPDTTIPTPGTTKTGENGLPTCYANANGGFMPPDDGIDWLGDQTVDLRLLNDRRLLPIAVVNCNALGNDLSGKESFAAAGFAYFFLTEPMAQIGSDAVIYGEFLGELDEGAKNKMLRDVVQIYRR